MDLLAFYPYFFWKNIEKLLASLVKGVSAYYKNAPITLINNFFPLRIRIELRIRHKKFFHPKVHEA